MSRSGSRKGNGDYDVGYGRPPVATRFQPGGIGNPKGRPKKAKSVGDVIHKAMMTRVPIEVNGRTKIMTAQEVIIQNLVRAAARADMKAIQTVFALQPVTQDSAATVLDPSDLEAEDRKIIEEHLAKLQASGADADTQTLGTAADHDKTEMSATAGEANAHADGGQS